MITGMSINGYAGPIGQVVNLLRLDLEPNTRRDFIRLVPPSSGGNIRSGAEKCPRHR